MSFTNDSTTSIVFSFDSELSPEIVSNPIYDWNGWIKSVAQVLEEGTSESGDLKIAVRCPWAGQHTSSTGSLETVIFIPDETRYPVFKCFHAHCVGKYFKDFLDFYHRKDLEKFSKQQKSIPLPGGLTPQDLIDASEENDLDSALIFLGQYGADSIAVASHDSPIIRHFTPEKITENNVLMILSNHAAWISKFNKIFGKQIVFDRLACTEWLLKKSKEAGIFGIRPECRKGLYFDVLDFQRVIVLNTGRNIYIAQNEKIYKYQEAWKIFKNLYVSTNSAIELADKNWSKEKAAMLEICFSSLPFEGRNVFVAGCVISAMICGVMDICPILHLSGDPGSGKSNIIEYLIAPLVKAAGGNFCTSPTTAAGIEQKIEGNCPVIYDEFEPKSILNRDRVESVLDIALSSSTSGAEVIKGTQKGIALTRTMKCGFIFAAVETKDDRQTVNRRTIYVTVNPTSEHRKNWVEIKKVLDDVSTPQNCKEFYRWLVDNVQLIRNCIIAVSKVLSERVKDRAKNFAIAPYAVAVGSYIAAFRQRDNLLPDDDIILNSVVSIICEDSTEDIDTQNVGVDGLNKLLLIELKRLDGSSVQMQDLLIDFLKSNTEDVASMLASHGVRVEKDTLCVSNTHPVLVSLFKKYGIVDHKRILKSVKGATKSEGSLKFKGLPARYVAIPLDLIRNRLSDYLKPQKAVEKVDLDLLLQNFDFSKEIK
jgi:hypothetical protein